MRSPTQWLFFRHFFGDEEEEGEEEVADPEDGSEGNLVVFQKVESLTKKAFSLGFSPRSQTRNQKCVNVFSRAGPLEPGFLV